MKVVLVGNESESGSCWKWKWLMYCPSPPSQKPGTLAISLGENENYWLVSGPSVREQCATVLHFPQPPNPFHPNNSTSSILTLLLTNPYNPEKDSTLIQFLIDSFPIIPILLSVLLISLAVDPLMPSNLPFHHVWCWSRFWTPKCHAQKKKNGFWHCHTLPSPN